ncbi:hypothetical protein FJ970_26130 [Mesorhizobium sp. B2-1-8]|uniref:hypothetical protein n=1 Tax=Mesorhizobium sp. B2-1-8 TaxID=2589967 RepID=UPI00112CE2B1|nr:hypothetical protein [Mesorhizobium sp. B2-1-8]UCI18505.1 hypothetical protein FJ970_26130 [Mesorhizobium sp. B2-1-8]
MPKLFLHVGAGKCASTSIQSFIFENATRLNEYGILVSDQSLVFGSRGDNPIFFFQDLIDRNDLSGEAVLRAVERLGRHDGLIAAENLSNPVAAQLFKEVAQYFDIHVFHVIRRQDDWLYSSWKQWYSKTGQSLGEYIDAAIQRGEPGFAKTVSAWARVAKTVKTITLDTKPSLKVETLNWLGLADDGGYSEFPSEMNPSFDFRIIDLLSRYRTVYDDAHDRKIEQFVSTYSRLGVSERFKLTADLSAKIMDRFYDENVSLLGAEIASSLLAEGRGERTAVSGFSQTDEHDFAIACLLEGMGRMAEEIAQLRADLNAVHKRTIGK